MFEENDKAELLFDMHIVKDMNSHVKLQETAERRIAHI
jgi:hypothetical protein